MVLQKTVNLSMASNQCAPDCASLDILLSQRLVTTYFAINQTFWPTYGPGAEYLLIYLTKPMAFQCY